MAKASALGKQQQYARVHNGEIVRPVLYDGRATGHGKFFAAAIGDKMIEQNGRPVPFRSIGKVQPV